jgi:hypothetical protein
VHFLPAARDELDSLPVPERRAMDHAVEKLQALGAQLPFPHSSHVEGAVKLFELRPRAGRSPWRAFYRQVGAAMVIAAIGPETNVDPPWVCTRREGRTAAAQYLGSGVAWRTRRS